jgi:hypothetical protein
LLDQCPELLDGGRITEAAADLAPLVPELARQVVDLGLAASQMAVSAPPRAVRAVKPVSKTYYTRLATMEADAEAYWRGR